MFNCGRNHRIALFLMGSLMGMSSSLLSGCRIGNHTEDPNSNKSDKVSGYYLTLPQSLALYITTETTSHSDAPITYIPANIAATFSNPLAFVLDDPNIGSAFIAHSSGKNALPAFINPDMTVEGAWTTSAKTYWQDPQCQNYFEISESGKLIPDTSLTPPTGFNHRVSGRLQINLEVIVQFSGDCTKTFQSIQDCYFDANKCGASTGAENLSTHDSVVATYDPFIHSKLITATDISKIRNFAYKVSYK